MAAGSAGAAGISKWTPMAAASTGAAGCAGITSFSAGPAVAKPGVLTKNKSHSRTSSTVQGATKVTAPRTRSEPAGENTQLAPRSTTWLTDTAGRRTLGTVYFTAKSRPSRNA